MLKRTSLILVLLIGACADVPPKSSGEAKTNQVPTTCCAAEAGRNATDLVRGKATVFELDNASPAIQFPQGTSRAAFVRFPSDLPERRLLVKVHPLGILIATLDIFCPSVEFLDSSGAIIESKLDVPLNYRHEMTWTSNGYYFAFLNIPSAATQAVFHTTDTTLGLKVPYPDAPTGYMFNAGKTPIFVDSGYRGFAIPCVNTGRIEIEVR